MLEFTPEDQERAKAWLREQAHPEDGRRGLSSYDIRDILEPFGKPSQSTVSLGIRNLPQDLKKTLITSILALLASQEAEAKRVADAKAAVTQPPRDVTESVAATEQVEAQPTAEEQAYKRQEKLVHDQLWAVIARQVERGLVPESDLSEGTVRGDGVYYLEELLLFNYQDEGAEAVGFLNRDDALPDGRPASYYKDGVSPEWRQQKWALPKSATRDQMIGDHRPAHLVTVTPYYDDNWFWAHLKEMVDIWRARLRQFESWITDGVPPMPSREYAEDYEKLLILTAQLHEMKLTYEGPEPDVTYKTLRQDIDVLRVGVLRGEDAEKASRWVARIAWYVLGLILVGFFLVWAGPSISRGLMSLKATAESWVPTARQWGTEIGLFLASPWPVGILLGMALIIFFGRVYYVTTLDPWEKKDVDWWMVILGAFVILLVIGLVASVIMFKILPQLR